MGSAMIATSCARFLRRLIPHTVLLAGLLPSALFAAGKLIHLQTDGDSGVKIEVESWLDACPPCGMVPFILRITNGAGSAHDWTLTVADGYGGGTRTTLDVTVPAGRTAEFPFTAMAGLRPSGSGYYRMMVFTVAGYGSRGSSGQLQQPDTLSRHPHTTETPFLGVGAELALKGWSALADSFAKAGGKPGAVGFDATQVDLARAPDDWRGFSGLSQLWMTDGEWSAMGGGAKAALLDWVAFGGRVVLFASDTSDARLAGLKVPSPDADGARRIGAGSVSMQKWDGTTFPLEDAVALAKSVTRDPAPKQLAKYGGGSWKLRDAVAAPSLRAALVFGFIVGFGILVGPVNLYWLAGPRRRQRLFWTTPLISLAGSALLVALMILQDGIGGSGARRVLALILPERNKLALVQEQISRTGVLAGRSFAIGEPSWMQQVATDRSGTAFNPMRTTNRRFTESNGRERSGDWFTNRAVQAQVIEAVRPSRGRIEVVAGEGGDGPPSVLSSLGATLATVFVVDHRRRYWRAEEIGAGERKRMRASTERDFLEWLDAAALSEMGPVPGAMLSEISRLPGQAFAESADASKFAVRTLDSIRWNDDRVIFAGPYLTR